MLMIVITKNKKRMNIYPSQVSKRRKKYVDKLIKSIIILDVVIHVFRVFGTLPTGAKMIMISLFKFLNSST